MKQFEKFSMHYGYEINFCNPDSGHEKGNVENKVGYIRRNMFVPRPHFDNIENYNKELLIKCDKDMQRMHYKKEKPISDLLNEEKAYMFKLPDKEFSVYRLKTVKADKYGKIEFETNTYSTSPAYSNKEVIIRITADKIIAINQEYKTIIEHQRIYDKYKGSMKWYPYLELMAQRPNAIKYTSFFNDLPDIWKNYIDSKNKEGKRQSIKALMKMIDGQNENKFEYAEKAIEETLKRGINDLDSIMATYYRIKNIDVIAKNEKNIEININSDIPKIKEYKTDISKYDNLCNKAVTAL